jgi:hypothetical protein
MFCVAVVKVFGPEYLRPPNAVDIVAYLDRNMDILMKIAKILRGLLRYNPLPQTNQTKPAVQAHI